MFWIARSGWGGTAVAVGIGLGAAVLVGGSSAVGLAGGTAVSGGVAELLETAVGKTAASGKLDEVEQPANIKKTRKVNARNLRPITNPLQIFTKQILNWVNFPGNHFRGHGLMRSFRGNE